MKHSLRAIVFRWMIAVILVTAVIRVGLWLAYQAYEAQRGHIVFHEQISELLLLLLVEVLGLLVLGLMLWGLSRVLLSPIRSVANTAHLISRGRLDKRIRTAHLPEGELLDIAETLNASFDRYQEAIERISRFSTSAAHQLRTPLTAIRTTAELALSKAEPASDQQDALVSILEDVERLSRMTEQLLFLSRLDAEHLRDEFAEVDLSDIARKVHEAYRPVAESEGIGLHLDVAEDCRAYGGETLLLEAVMNLVDNAVKWAGRDGTVSIQTTRDGRTVGLRVTDSGPGLDEAFKLHAFEPFSRHPSATYEGNGLGLSIASDVVRLHDGHLTVETGPSGGASFLLVLPAARSTGAITVQPRA